MILDCKGGLIAQLAERHFCKVEATGSNPVESTLAIGTLWWRKKGKRCEALIVQRIGRRIPDPAIGVRILVGAQWKNLQIKFLQVLTTNKLRR